jgi:hypothetical protein
VRSQRGECIESDGSCGVCFLFLIFLFFFISLTWMTKGGRWKERCEDFAFARSAVN